MRQGGVNDGHRQRWLSNKPRPEAHHGGLIEQLATQSRSTKRQSGNLTYNQSSAAEPLRLHHCDKRFMRSMVAAVGQASTQLPIVAVRMRLNFSAQCKTRRRLHAPTALLFESS